MSSSGARAPGAAAGLFQKFDYLTGETPLPNRADGKTYKQLYTENSLRRELLRKNPSNPGKIQKPDPNFLRPPEDVCL